MPDLFRVSVKELQTILHILKTTTEGVLATLVKVEGSSYRRVGARLLWRPTGPRIGSISGGCLEDDLIEHARLVFATGQSRTVVYDTTGENDLVWGVGLGCHGIVHILLERVSGIPQPWQAVARAWEKREAAALALAFGNDPRACGTLLGCSASGEIASSQRQLPADLVEAGRACLLSQKSHYVRFPPGSGEASLLWEYLPPPLCLAIFGAGDDAIPLVRMAKEFGWRVVVVDPRAAFATRERFSEADQVLVKPAEDVASLEWDAATVVVVMTHHYRFDLPILRALLPAGFSYLGLLGPKKRAEKICDELTAEGLTITAEMRRRLHAPVGLDLGGGSPEEVALAIIAEIQAALGGRDARPLRERNRPIHD